MGLCGGVGEWERWLLVFLPVAEGLGLGFRGCGCVAARVWCVVCVMGVPLRRAPRASAAKGPGACGGAMVVC